MPSEHEGRLLYFFSLQSCPLRRTPGPHRGQDRIGGRVDLVITIPYVCLLICPFFPISFHLPQIQALSPLPLSLLLSSPVLLSGSQLSDLEIAGETGQGSSAVGDVQEKTEIFSRTV